jgi:hypothetical protein
VSLENKIGQLLENRISIVIPGADYWFVKCFVVYAACVSKPKIAFIRGNLARGSETSSGEVDVTCE